MDGVYDSLSRITSETRTFTGLSNQYGITYGYNLAGEVTSVTDPSGAQVSYNYDPTGRLTSMPASGYNGVTSFLSNAQYRASGAMKHATYGNSVQVDLTYNARLQIGQYQVSGFQSPFGTMGATMSYYDDGRTNTAYDLNDSRFDRKYEFDFSARLKEAYSGVEAHGQPAPPLSQATSPYRQTYAYDAWNNVTLRIGRIWSVSQDYDQATYGSDNKRQGFGYDAAGNVTWTGNTEGTRTYDAAGRPVTLTSSQTWRVYPNWPSSHPDAPALETQDTFDGTGQVAKHVATTRHDDTYDSGGGNLVYTMSDTTTTTYYLHSTVLGGKTIAELDQFGFKRIGYVYSGGARIATQHLWTGGANVEIESTNPVTGAAILTDANGSSAGRQEPDPLGRDLTQALDPTVVVDPLASSKWNEPMPIEYAPNWTGEMEIGMAQYVDTMQMTEAREAYTRWLKERKNNPDLYNKTNTNYNIWQNILNKNPNLGIANGDERLWGEAAATFLEKNANFMSLGVNGITFQPQNKVSQSSWSSNATMTIIWETDGTASPVGHVSYVTMQNDKSYSWQGIWNWTQNQPSSDYTDERSKASAGMGYVLDFGTTINEKFQKALLHAYDYCYTGYDPVVNNCGEAFNRAINAIRKDIGVPASHKVRPSATENYIQTNLLPRGFVVGQHPFPKH